MSVADELLASVHGRRGVDAADRLCEACVILLEVDDAALSLVFDGANKGTLGSSSAEAREYDELQFTLGEGPCLDAVAEHALVSVADLADPVGQRWPGYGPAMLDKQVRGVHALPVVVAGEYVGALALFCSTPGELSSQKLGDAAVAAELAGLHVFDLLDVDLQAAASDPDSVAWGELNALSRTEVSQATGMLVAQLGVEPGEALVRLRAHAYATGRPATDVARAILARTLTLEL
ncbi:GAF and ANTAR domain-containing protein [Mycolicibacterium iranicum]|uniref:Antitermination regulator n=1 Tax=Mycolicibacterium iranicum TaxID=912594 RepID=A0A178LHX5_MYCIR|nr:GAF and ANTAR domain-containing protein [Mycolicibacterium iranicum]OAN30186.1 antitermination regulator [Mycolicibacterium iranicum]